MVNVSDFIGDKVFSSNDSELISNKDGREDNDKTQSDDSKDEGIRSGKDGKPLMTVSDSIGNAKALKNLDRAAVTRVEKL